MIRKFYDYEGLGFGGDSTPKPYFAKWLPVEGEIKPPCIVLETLTTGEKELFQVDTKNDIDVERQQLVKLFLCSRDIQVGDVFISGISKDEWVKGIDMRMHPDDYKIIGEISPEATWVKEGDEFDEHEVYKLEGVINALNGQTVPTWCVIKGPCGHFH